MADPDKADGKPRCLSIGDIICLYCVDIKGYVFCDRTSAAQNKLYLYNDQDMAKPTGVPNPQALAFQVRIQNRFKLGKKYRKMVARSKEEAVPHWELEAAKNSAAAENQDNIIEQSRLHGKPVQYGMILQLRHIYSDKYVHVDNTRTSSRDKSKLMVHLLVHDGKSAHFRLLPRYKVNAEGEPVLIGDQVSFESIKTPGQYLHASPAFAFSRGKFSELNLGVDCSEFTICHRFSPTKWHMDHTYLWPGTEEYIQGGAVIQLYHRHLEAYLSAESSSSKSPKESVHLRVRPADLLRPRTLYLPTSCFTLWQLEDEKSIIIGKEIKWEQRIRMRHLATRMYLAVDVNAKEPVFLSQSGSDPRTVFRLHSRNNEVGTVGNQCCTRIEHVLTGQWLHGNKDENYVKKRESWVEGTWKKVTISQSPLYMDAFDLCLCPERHILNNNFLAGIVPLIQDIASQGSDECEGVDERFNSLMTALSELKSFLQDSASVGQNRRKMFRELWLVDLLVDLLQSDSVSQWPVKSYQKRLFEGVYDVFYIYIQSGSSDDALYLAQFLDFFLSQIKLKKGFGFQVTRMMVELIRDRREVVERITLKQIDSFISLLKKFGHHRYIQLLSTLCVVEGLALPANQSRMCDHLIDGKKYKECLLSIWIQDGDVMVSKDADMQQISLLQFLKGTEENFHFLEEQLKLYQQLCHGRNQHCIDSISKESITWDVIMSVIKSQKIPDDVKAMFMDLIIVLYIDVGENTPFQQIMTNTFEYEQVQREEFVLDWLKRKFKYVEFERLKDQLGYLESWISAFLHSNQHMVASNKERNTLIISVIKVLRSLLSFGFVRNPRILEWKNGVLRIMNSSADPPTMIMDAVRLMTNSESGSYVVNETNKAFVEAKYEALKTMDLLLDVSFHFRVQKIVGIFKDVESSYQDPKSRDKDPLCALFEENFAPKKVLWRMWDPLADASKELDKLFSSTDVFDPCLLERSVMNLAKYRYPVMTAKSLEVLKRLNTAREDVIKGAQSAKLIQTESTLNLYRTAQTFMPLLHRLLNVKLYDDQMYLVAALLDTRFKQCCRSQHDENIPHFIGQQILVAHGIIPLLMAILDRESKTTEQAATEAQRTLVHNTLHLLQLMTRDNPEVQALLMAHLDTLLKLSLAPSSLAETLKTLFHNNAPGAWRITSQQIKILVELICKHQDRVPAFVQVLSNLIVVSDDCAPIRRSQTLVMKHLLEGYPHDAYVFEQPPSTRRQILLLQQGNGILEYFLHLLNLLVYCGHGTRGSIRSFCQNVLSLGEILGLLANPDICTNFKRPLVKYLNRIYMQASDQLGQTAKTMVHNSDLWRFLQLVDSDLAFCLNELQIAKVERAPVPRTLDTCYYPDTQATLDVMKCKLFYFIDAVFDFLWEFKSVYQNYLDVAQYPEELPILTGITNKLTKVSFLMARSVPENRHYRSMRGALQAMMALVKFPEKEMEIWIQGLDNGRNENPGGKMPVILDTKVTKEIQINEMLQRFTRNLEKTLHQANTVKAQLKISDNNLKTREYATGTTGSGLPLGKAFQDHVALFQNRSMVMWAQYKRVKIILRHLRTAADQAKLIPHDPAEVALNIRYLQILRATIHNIIITLPADWALKKRGSTTSRLMQIRSLQDFYVNEGLVEMAFSLLNMQENSILHEVLALLCSLLFNANLSVQDTCLRYFESTREEIFFMVLIEQFHRGTAIIKERRVFEAAKKKQLEDWTIDPKMEPDRVSMRGYNEVTSQAVGEPEHLFKSEDDNAMMMMLAVLGTLCDGQHRGMQDYLRYQPDNLRSFDVVAEATSFLSMLCSIDNKTIQLVTQIFLTLNEICQGNQQNRVVTLDNKVVDHINTIIRSDFCDHCSHMETLVLYRAMADFLMSLVEENGPDALRVAQEVAATLDRKAVLHVLGFCYKIRRDKVWPSRSAFTLWKANRVSPNEFTRITKAEIKKAKSTAIKYYIIYSRLIDVISLDAMKVSDEKTEASARALDAYRHRVASIEIVKDNHLQKVYFPLPKKSQIREEVKDRLLWNIDRTSPTNKIRDFIKWARVIKQDILYNRKVLSNPITMFISRQWKLWNIIIIGLSLIINIIMLVTWEASVSIADVPKNATSLPAAINDPTPKYRFIQDYTLWLLVLGSIHNIFSVILLVSYFLIHNPSLPRFTSLRRWFRKTRIKHDDRAMDDDDGGEKHKNDHSSELNPGIFTSNTIFILILVVSSFAGTFTNGYFFAVHLLNIVNINELLKGVIKAVTQNGWSLLWVTVLGFIMLYIFALLGFAFFRPSFIPERQLYCGTLYQCAITIIRYGMIGDIDEVLRLHPLQNTFWNFGFLVVYQLSFFVLFTTIGLNIIFGIIVDTFSELRDLKWTAEKDMQELCFICSRQSYDFEHYSKGFRFHTKKEHNIWDYIYYFLYLTDTNPNDYSALDVFVSSKLDTDQYDFFPINRALCLVHNDKEAGESKLDTIAHDVTQLKDRNKKEDIRRELQLRRYENMRWRETHLTPGSTSRGQAHRTFRTLVRSASRQSITERSDLDLPQYSGGVMGETPRGTMFNLAMTDFLERYLMLSGSEGTGSPARAELLTQQASYTAETEATISEESSLDPEAAEEEVQDDQSSESGPAQPKNKS